MRIFVLFFYGLLSVFIFSGCKKANELALTDTTKPITQPPTTTTGNPPSKTAAEQLADELSNAASEETTIVKPDSLWEAGGLVWCSAHQSGDMVYLYYLADDGSKHRHLCYAYSYDGVNFIKPNLYQYTFNGNKRNNIIDIPLYTATFFYDSSSETTPYRLCGMGGDSKLHTATSKDGVYFTMDPKVLVDYFADSQNQVIYDAETRKYKYYLRNYVYDTTIAKPYQNIFYYRAVAYYEADSLEEIKVAANALHHPFSSSLYSITTEYPTILNYDRSIAECDVYTGGVVKYAKNMYLAHASIFHHYSPAESATGSTSDGYQSISLYTSANGKDFKLNNAKFIDNQPNSYYLGPGFASKGGRLINYYWKVTSTHGSKVRQSQLVAVSYAISPQLLATINAYNNLP